MKYSVIALGFSALLAATAVQAQGVTSSAEAAAEFDAAVQSGLKASSRSEAIKCAGYWLGLKEVHNASQGVAFWQQLPSRLSAETADLGHQYWSAVVREAFAGDQSRLEAAGNQVFEQRQAMIQKVVDAQNTGSIEGVFDTLGYCVPA